MGCKGTKKRYIPCNLPVKFSKYPKIEDKTFRRTNFSSSQPFVVRRTRKRLMCYLKKTLKGTSYALRFVLYEDGGLFNDGGLFIQFYEHRIRRLFPTGKYSVRLKGVKTVSVSLSYNKLKTSCHYLCLDVVLRSFYDHF